MKKLSLGWLGCLALATTVGCGSTADGSGASGAPGNDAAGPAATGDAAAGQPQAGDAATQGSGGPDSMASGDSGAPATAPSPDGAPTPDAPAPDAAGGTGGTPDSAGRVDAGKDSMAPFDIGTTPPPAKGSTCAIPIQPVDVTRSTVVGSGAGSCTEALLAAAVAKGGNITFNCGAGATIKLTQALQLRTDVVTTIDGGAGTGGGGITLDGGGAVRILSFNGPDWDKTGTTVTLQHMTLAHGFAAGSNVFPPASAPCSQGFQTGGGGAILFRDGVLHVIDVTFENNVGEGPGPDIAGGAIYALGSKDVTIVSSRFVGNGASNGGAVGCLWSHLNVVNSVFSNNRATGSGANSINATCPVVGGQRETGSGGNGGAVVIDGGDPFTDTFCGDVFANNAAGVAALGGVVFRTPDIDSQTTTFDQCTFDGNAGETASVLYFHNSTLRVSNSTFSNNVGKSSGAIQADATTLELVNDTFSHNSVTAGFGGCAQLWGIAGTVKNCTFSGNIASGFAPTLAGSVTWDIENSLFVANTGGGSPCASMGTGTGNLQWPMSGPCTAGVAFKDPMLGPLADNGGAAPTLMPMAGSPAIGAGHACPATDERQHPRATTTCASGAVEVP